MSLQQGKTLCVSAAQGGVDEKTARKYRDLGCLPSQCRAEHTWRTPRDHREMKCGVCQQTISFHLMSSVISNYWHFHWSHIFNHWKFIGAM